MRRRITAFISALTVFALPICGTFARETDYFGEFQFPQTDFSQIAYTRYDKSGFDSRVNAIKAVTQAPGADSDELSALLEQASGDITDAASMYVLANLNESKNNSDENNQERETAFNIFSDMDKEYKALCAGLSESEYRGALEEFFGGAEALETFLETIHSDKYYSLIQQEQELISEYRKNEFGSYVYTTDDGMEVTYSDLTDYISSLGEDIKNNGSTALSKEMYNKLTRYMSEYTSESNRALAGIYLKLVRLRAEIAAEEGYDNYADYAYEKIYHRDFTTGDAAALSGYVKNHIHETFSGVQSAVYTLKLPDITMTDEEMFGVLGSCVEDISSELRASFDYMLERHMYDTERSDAKIAPGSAYTTYLYSYRTPYLFMSPFDNNNKWKLDALTHEFGHFNAMLYDPYNRSLSSSQSAMDAMDDMGMSIDAAEINSQGLEMLMTEYYDVIYGGSVRSRELDAVSDMLGTIVSACEISDFENYVYKTPGLTLDDLNEYADVPLIEHLFTNPLYYISYATSAMASLGIWDSMKNEGFDTAADKYLRLAAAGDYVPFRAVTASSGLGDIFTEEYSRHISETVQREFGMNFHDIIPGRWYYKAVLETREYIDPFSEEYFGVSESVTRAETAKSIVKMYGGDVSGSSSGFYDVSPDDDRYIGWAKDNSIIMGYSDTVFGPEDGVSREQAVLMLYRLAKALGIAEPVYGALGFDDSAAVSPWAYDAVIWAWNNGIIEGYENNTFRPAAGINKAQLAQMLCNTYELFFGVSGGRFGH